MCVRHCARLRGGRRGKEGLVNKKHLEAGLMEFTVIEKLQHLINKKWYRRSAASCQPRRN